MPGASSSMSLSVAVSDGVPLLSPGVESSSARPSALAAVVISALLMMLVPMYAASIVSVMSTVVLAPAARLPTV